MRLRGALKCLLEIGGRGVPRVAGNTTGKGIDTHQNMHYPPAEEMDEMDYQKSVQANLLNSNVLC